MLVIRQHGGISLRHKINPSVAPRGRRKSLVGSLQFHTKKRAQWTVLLPKPSLPLDKADQTPQISPCFTARQAAPFLGSRLVLHGRNVNGRRIHSRRHFRFQVLLVNQTVAPREL